MAGVVKQVMLAFGVSWALVACRGCEPAEAPPKATAPADAPVGAVPANTAGKAPGVLIGTVRLAAGAQLPSYPPAQMERKVLDQLERGTFPESCTPPKTTDRTPVSVTPDGKLVGVMVAVSEFSKGPQRAPQTHDVAIKDCRLTPKLVIAMQGDLLRITNEVNFPFMPVFGNEQVLKTLIPTQTKEVQLQEVGVNSIVCGFTAPCGRTDVVVLYHPLYAVTGEDGTFRIEGFPADETVNVNAWHPLFEAQQLSVKLGSGETKSVELTIVPKASAPVAPTPAPK